MVDDVRTSLPSMPIPVRQSAPEFGLTGKSPLAVAQEQIVTCERCRRLREYCQRIATIKKAAHRDDVYWGRPVPGLVTRSPVC